MNKSEINPLANEPVKRLFFKLALPAVIAQIINLLYNLIDRIFIGHIEEVGDVALTGVGITFPIIILISAVSCLCGMGGAPKAAIKMGEKDYKGANKILGNCITLTLVFSLLLTVLLQIFKEPLLYTFAASDNTFKYAYDYITIYAYGTTFVMISLGLNSFITTQGFSKISMMNVAIGAILNIILDPIFIFGFNLGVKGAAIATIISQFVSSLLVIRFLLSKKSKLKVTLSDLKLDIKVVLSIIALGLSPFIMQSTESIISVCFNTSLYKYGGDLAVGTMTILSSLMQFAMLPLQGFAQGAQPIISFNYGAKNARRIKEAFKLMFIISVSFSFVFWLTSMLFPSALISIFTTKQELIIFASRALRIYMAVILIFGVQIACQQTFVSLGNAPVSLFLAIFRKIILLIPLIYIVPLFMDNKCDAIFLAEPIADFLAVSTTAVMFYFIFRKTMRNIEQNNC